MSSAVGGVSQYPTNYTTTKKENTTNKSLHQKWSIVKGNRVSTGSTTVVAWLDFWDKT